MELVTSKLCAVFLEVGGIKRDIKHNVDKAGFCMIEFFEKYTQPNVNLQIKQLRDEIISSKKVTKEVAVKGICDQWLNHIYEGAAVPSWAKVNGNSLKGAVDKYPSPLPSSDFDCPDTLSDLINGDD